MAVRERHWLTTKGEKRTAWIADYWNGRHAMRRSCQFATKEEAEAWLLQMKNTAGLTRDENGRIEEAIDAAIEGLETEVCSRFSDWDYQAVPAVIIRRSRDAMRAYAQALLVNVAAGG